MSANSTFEDELQYLYKDDNDSLSQECISERWGDGEEGKVYMEHALLLGIPAILVLIVGVSILGILHARESVDVSVSKTESTVTEPRMEEDDEDLAFIQQEGQTGAAVQKHWKMIQVEGI